ncbi:MAG: hypothetical protein Q9171_001977 [Xanthocarpia ochracea]
MSDQDLEGDVRMQSSSEASEDDLDAMFPKANEPSNTANLTHQNTSITENMRQFSELSPPTSQDPTDPRSFVNDPMESAANGGEASSSNSRGFFENEVSAVALKKDLSVAEREPGASWNNRKHKDEEDRVKDQLLDKNFSLREFGDLYNEKDMSDEI